MGFSGLVEVPLLGMTVLLGCLLRQTLKKELTISLFLAILILHAGW